MLKFSPLLLASCFCAVTLHAQSEPQKAQGTGKATPAPNIKDTSKAPADKQAPVATPAPADTTTAAAKPKIDKDPPPFDINHMDKSVNPAEDFTPMRSAVG
jgi:hypothetical protein